MVIKKWERGNYQKQKRPYLEKSEEISLSQFVFWGYLVAGDLVQELWVRSSAEQEDPS